MYLDKSAIEKIAWLAQLSIETEDIPIYSRELSNILEMVEHMGSINTSGISPLAHPLDILARLREDQVTETNQRGVFQKHAPLTEDGYYLVPKVIK